MTIQAWSFDLHWGSLESTIFLQLQFPWPISRDCSGEVISTKATRGRFGQNILFQSLRIFVSRTKSLYWLISGCMFSGIRNIQTLLILRMHNKARRIQNISYAKSQIISAVWNNNTESLFADNVGRENEFEVVIIKSSNPFDNGILTIPLRIPRRLLLCLATLLSVMKFSSIKLLHLQLRQR